ERSLVGIGPEEVWNARIPAGVEERSGLIGKKSAIDHRSEVSLREVRQERARRKLSEAAQLIGRAAATDRGCERLGGRVTFRRRRLTRGASAALADSATKQPAGGTRCDLQAHILGACRLAEDRHLLRVAPERDDVGPHPLERGTLVEQALIPGEGVRWILRCERVVCEEPEGVQSIIDRDDDHVLLLGED